jgi:hypothetical protein
VTETPSAHPAPTRRSLVIAIVVGALCLVAAGALVWQLSRDGSSDDGSATTVASAAEETTVGEAEEPGGAADPPPDAAGRVLLEGLRGDRYCEILAVTATGGTYIAEVHNTIGLNDCPQDAWEAIDLGAVAADLGVDVAVRNGPRLWAIDSLEKVAEAEPVPVREVGGIEMRVVATVDVGSSLAEAGARYVAREVTRRTVFTWDGGRSVGILTDPDGNEFVLQAWSLQQASDLGDAALPSLGDRLELPDGWSFDLRELTEPLVVDTTEAPARVLQDDLGNAYTQLPG